MSWPFTTVGAPNFDTGPGQAVPTSPTALTAAQTWLLGAHFTNPTVVAITVTVTDTAGDVVGEVDLPATSEQPYEWPFRPVTGLKWGATATGVVGQLWGYQ